MKAIDEANLDKYKKESEEYKKLTSDLRRILKFISTEDLIGELKKRKLLKFNWLSEKYEEQEDQELINKMNEKYEK